MSKSIFVAAALALLSLSSKPSFAKSSVENCQSLLSAFYPGRIAQKKEAKAMWKEIENFWGDYFAARGLPFEPAILVLYEGKIKTRKCGVVKSQIGPVYCPSEGKVYLDFSMWEMMSDKYGVSGGPWRLYALAHEYGHHVLKLTGVLPKIRQTQSLFEGGGANLISVMHELTADALAGFFFGHLYRQGILAGYEVESASEAAAKVGDDFVIAQQYAVKGTACFTHGSSGQRATWFAKGVMARSVAALSAFQEPELLAPFTPAWQKALSLIGVTSF